MGYYVFFSGSSQITTNHKYIFVLLTIYLGYTNYVAITRNRKRIPTLIISDFALEVSEYLKTTTYTWKDIIDWKIETKDGTDYLTISTIEPRKRMINISFLEKTPFEIEQLITEIKKH
jgi:hypothetical protein